VEVKGEAQISRISVTVVEQEVFEGLALLEFQAEGVHLHEDFLSVIAADA